MEERGKKRYKTVGRGKGMMSYRLFYNVGLAGRGEKTEKDCFY